MKQLFHLIIVALLGVVYYTWFNLGLLTLVNPLLLYILSVYIFSGWRQSLYSLIYSSMMLSIHEYDFIWPVIILLVVLTEYIILHKTLLHGQSIRSLISLQVVSVTSYIILTYASRGLVRGFIRTNISLDTNSIKARY